MQPERAAQALAQASSSLTRPSDVAGALVGLLDNCRVGIDVDAGAILVDSPGGLELLASSSHQVTELELHQLHINEGPCVDAFRTGTSVQAHSAEEIEQRWPHFARTMLEADFQSVLATPLQIQGVTIGAKGLFRRAVTEFTPDEEVVAHAFADIAAVLVVHLGEVTPEKLSERLQRALDARVLIEQAKGVLAGIHDLTMADAYDLLVQSARDRREPLTSWATQVIDSAQNARPTGTEKRAPDDAGRSS